MKARDVLLILCGAVVLRLLFVVGFVGGQPQDDGIYINLARAIDHGYSNLDRFQHAGRDVLANPADTFVFRVVFVYPLPPCFWLFGEGDRSAICAALVGALAGIAAWAAIAGEIFGRRAGVFTGVLLATLPHDILYSTRVLADTMFGAA